MSYKIKTSSGTLLIGSHLFENTPTNIVELPVLTVDHFSEIFESLENGDLDIELDGVSVSNPLHVFSALIGLVTKTGEYTLNDNNALRYQWYEKEGVLLGEKIRIRPSDSSSEIPVIESFNDIVQDWETGTLEVGSGSIKVGAATLSQHGDTMSISDAEGNKKVIPTLKIDNNLIGDSVTVDVGDIAEFDVAVQSIDTFEYVGNELIFYGSGLANSIVSVLKGVAGSVAPTTSVQLIVYRGWHSESTVLNNVHNSSLNKIVQKGIPKSQFGTSSAFDVNLSEAVQFYLGGPYTVLMRTTHRDSSNFSLMGTELAPNPLGGTQFVPKISVDRTVQKNVHLFTERDGSHLDADVFAVAGLNQDTDLRYGDVQDAINACPDKGTVQIVGNYNSVVLPSDKSINLKGVGGATIGHSSYDGTNEDCIYQSDPTSTQEYGIYNLRVKNSGGYGIHIKGASKAVVEDCKILNNGWDGTQLNTVLPSTTTGLLGYDSTDTDLQAFYAGDHASDGGAMRIENVTQVEIIGNNVKNNLRGIRLQDCGVGGYGFVTRNVSTQNIESGIYLAAGSTYYGCQNIVVTINSSAYNANNGLLCIGGINNKFSQNEVNGNWNGGYVQWGSGNSTLRDCGLYDNNRSNYNGIGNIGDAKASIQINEAYNLLGTTISLNPEARFIAEILDTQVHYTGLGSNTDKAGFLITSGVGALPDNPKNIIKIDDVGFIGQDYAIDLSEVDITNLRFSLGDNSYQSIGIKAVKPPLFGNYSELPFSNHVMSVPQVDIVVDVVKQMVSLHEGVGGNVINTYKANELKSIINGSKIDIIQKFSDKIQLRDLSLNNVFVNGVVAGNSVSSMNDTVNAAFELTLEEYKEFLVSEVGVNTGGGETLPAIANNWYKAFGANAGNQVTTPTVTAADKGHQPFYNGDFLDKGHEYIWTHDGSGSYVLGIWNGVEQNYDETEVFNAARWSTNFVFGATTGKVLETSVGVDVASRYVSGYTVTNNTVLSLRYGNDNYLYLLDITGGDEVIIGKSNTTLVGDTQTIYFGGGNQPNAKIPVMQERTDRWTIVHDFDNSENGEWADGIEAQTIIKSNMYLEPGEKFNFILPGTGGNKHYGLSYNGAVSGETNPISGLIDGAWRWDAGEIIHNMVGWTMNTGSTGYGRNISQPNKWGVIDGQPHTVSYRHKSDNTMEMWSEDDNDLIMTYNVSTNGFPMHLFYGAVQYGTTLNAIPVLDKYNMTAAEEGANVSTWYYIESPDGVFSYPLFSTTSDANAIDVVEGGSGNSQGYSWGDDPTGEIWYGPETNFVNNANSAPSHGVYGNSTNVIWNEIETNADSSYTPTPFTDTTISINELTSLNLQIHPVDSDFTTTIANGPSWISQANNNDNITGFSPEIHGDNVNYSSETFTVDIVRTFADYGSSTGVLTIVVNNTTTPASLPGILHIGSVTDSSATNSSGKIYLGSFGNSGRLVYDLPNTLSDGDKIEWHHQDGSFGFGIVSSGTSKTIDLVDHDVDNSSKWDLLAPITGAFSNTNGQNFGNNFTPSIWPGMVPIGWDDNTNPQPIPTRPVYASSDVWKLYNNAGTIELYLNNVLFRSSSDSYVDPTITLAVPDQSGSGSDTATKEFPTFTHTANSASAPSGFVLESGDMDTSELLNGNSVASLTNKTLSPGQRLIVNKSWANTNVLPYFDGSGGTDNKVYIGVPKLGVSWTSVDLHTDFNAVHRWENNGSNNTGVAMSNGGTSVMDLVNRFDDVDSFYNVAIDYSREGHITVLRSSDLKPSLTTELIGGDFNSSQTWIDAHSTIGTDPLDLVIATKSLNSRVKLSESGINVITSPIPSDEFDVTEDSFNLPLFNGSVAGDITLEAGTTYKFWLHDSSIESSDNLSVCLISDNSDYTTGVTMIGTPGTFGSYLEFSVPSDVPPVKFKWTSNGSYYYVTPVVSNSSHVVNVSGVTLLGPSGDISGNIMNDDAYLEIDETIAAGQRIILNNAFISDLLTEMVSGSIGNQIHIGVKVDSGFSDTGSIHNNVYESHWIRLRYHGGQYLATMFDGSTQVGLKNYGSSLPTNASIFFELTSSGNNTRMGQENGTTSDPATTTYADWFFDSKQQTGDQGYGLSSVKLIFRFVHAGGSFDVSNVDWTELSEVSIPTSTAIITSWGKALDFSGSNEHAKQVSSNSSYNTLRMNGLSSTASAPSVVGNTSNSTFARPWATTVVFKSDRHNSNQHIWNSGEGASNGNDNIFLRHSSTGQLFFGWGREGSGYNEVYITTVNSSNWYGVYIGYNGARFNASNATASNLSDTFDIRVMTNESGDNFNTVYSLGNLPGSWTGTGNRMDRGISGDFTVGGRGNNRSFHGKIASMVVTTLKLNVAMPTDAEIKLMITDPKKWEDDYLIGNTIRQSHWTSNATYTPSNIYNGFGAVQMWLMGDGTNDSYSNMIRNQVYPSDQNYTKLQLNSMVSNDIETVSIQGLN